MERSKKVKTLKELKRGKNHSFRSTKRVAAELQAAICAKSQFFKFQQAIALIEIPKRRGGGGERWRGGFQRTDEGTRPSLPQFRLRVVAEASIVEPSERPLAPPKGHVFANETDATTK